MIPSTESPLEDPDKAFGGLALDHTRRLDIFSGNHQELHDVLSKFAAVEAFEASGTREYHRFQRQIERCFFNWLASAHALCDATRRLVRSPKFPDAEREVCDKVLDSDVMNFVHELRHLTIHDTLPDARAFHETSYSRLEGLKQGWTVEFVKRSLIPALSERAKSPRDGRAKKALAYVTAKPEQFGLWVEAATFEVQLMSYLTGLRRLVASTSWTAAAYLDLYEHPLRPRPVPPAEDGDLSGSVSFDPNQPLP